MLDKRVLAWISLALLLLVVAQVGPLPSEAAWGAAVVAVIALAKTVERVLVLFGLAPLPEGTWQKVQLGLVGAYTLFTLVGLLPFDFDLTIFVAAVDEAPVLLEAAIVVVNAVITFVSALLASKVLYELLAWANIPLLGYSKSRDDS